MSAPFEPSNTILRRSREGAVLRLVLADAARRNCLSDRMLTELQEALDAAASDPAVRAVVIAAEGPVFSSGHDLKEITRRRGDPDGGLAYFRDLFGRCAVLMQTIVALDKPVIAEVAGLATAAGCQLVASCDLAVAGEASRYQTPGVNFGLFCSTPMAALSRAVGRKHALEMLLTGDTVDAGRAEAMGLVNRVVPGERLTEEAMQLAHTIAEKSPVALRAGKAAFQRQLDLPLDDAYRLLTEVMAENLMAQEATDGIAALLDKRTPQFPAG